MLLELCVTELEDAATDTERIKAVPQPLVQESAHPYTDDAVQTGHVRIAGAEGLRVEFDRQVSMCVCNDTCTNLSHLHLVLQRACPFMGIRSRSVVESWPFRRSWIFCV